MKKTLIAASAALMMAACTSSPKAGAPTTFEGKFIGYGGEYVEFFIPTETGEYQEIQIVVDEDGTFNTEVQFGKDMYDCAIFADKYMYRVCLEQGKHYNAVFDMTNGSETEFEFTGEGSKENLFMRDYWKGFRYSDSVIDGLLACGSFEEFSAGIEHAAAPLREELKATNNKGFIDYYTKEMNSYELSYKFYYPFIRTSASGVYRPEQSYLDAIANAPKMTDEEYSSMIQFYAMNVPYMFPDINLREALRAVADFSSKQSRKEEGIAAVLQSYASMGGSKTLKDAYEYYKENVKNPDENLCKMIENAMSLGPGVAAPEIEFEDIDGNIKHLADFQGKPLYIDLWASWCGPCCEEIPHLAKFVASLGENPEIVCISISIDDNRNDWTAKLAEDNSEWPQYLATKDGQKAISRDYGVSGIPRFMLINADGTIASVNAGRPSDPDLLESLRAALK